ncbi:MAG: dienelactone hydrolase [Chloroflexi bacterium]|nr:dienelactone hydrolase [Chloroflexota bacterium]
MIGKSNLNNLYPKSWKGNWRWVAICLLGLTWLTACSSVDPTRVGGLPSTVIPTTTRAINSLPAPTTVRPTPVVVTSTPGLIPTLEPTPTSSVTPTSDPYENYTINYLSERPHGNGQLAIQEVIEVNSYFTRTLITYPSDSLAIYGFMNTPQERPGRPGPPFPVIIALHGYIEPEVYNTLDYTTGYADTLARAGYIVIHPNLRGYRPSDDGDNRFRVGMAIDVLNLIALVRQAAGQPGALALADGERIGLWGHSMGGGITTRVITVDPGIKAAVLYGAMSGDEQKNYERIYSYFSNGTRGLEELQTPEEALRRISPVNFLERIASAVSIHHGQEDLEVPLSWSVELCEQLKELAKVVECFTYPDQPHTFQGDGSELFMQRVIDFYDRILRN